MFAIINAKGKQYKAAKDDVILMDKLSAEVGAVVEFDAAVCFDDKNAVVAKPVKVVCEVTKQILGRKITVFKYKAKKNERKKQGHRQPYTIVKVVDIKA